MGILNIKITYYLNIVMRISFKNVFIFLFTYNVTIQIIECNQPRYIYPLEVKYTETYIGWNTSIYTSNYPYGFNSTYESNYTVQYSQNLDTINKNDLVTINLQDETYGVQISSVQISLNDTILTERHDVVIVSQISKEIFPANYFDTSKYTNNLGPNAMKKVIMECLYRNPGPGYTRAVLDNVNINNVVNTLNRNFGLKQGEKGIKVLTMNNFTLNYQSLDTYLMKMNKSIPTITNNLTFSKLLNFQESPETYSNIYYIAALTEQGDLFVYKVTDDNYDSIEIQQFAVIPGNIIKTKDINKFVVKNNTILITSMTRGLIVLVLSNASWSEISLVNPQFINMRDMVLIENTAYIIVEKYGMISFDLKSSQFNDNYFAHPNLTQIDLATFNGMSYIGVRVDNYPPNVPEFYIEFTYNFINPSRPLINKIYTSLQKVPLNQIAADNQLGLTYILDSKKNNLIIINRAIPNPLITYNFRINFNNYYLFNQTKELELFMLSTNDAYSPSLVIKNQEDYIMLGKFKFPKNTLRCKLKVVGNYSVKLSAQGDCSTNYPFKSYRNCFINSTFNVSVVEKIKNQYLELILLIVIIVISAVTIILSVICCRRRKCCRQKNYSKTMTNDKHEEVVEVVEIKNSHS